MRGIVLAGGSGSQLHPITLGVSKNLVPVCDKPMTCSPLSSLMLADILVITTPDNAEQFQRLLGDGSRFGINLSFTTQPSPDGVAQEFPIGADFIGDEPAELVLGDNTFHGLGLGRASTDPSGTCDALSAASSYVCAVERRHGLKIGAPEEIAWRDGFLSDDELRESAACLMESGYGGYLLELLEMSGERL